MLSLVNSWKHTDNYVRKGGIWEEMYNPDFNSPELEGIKNQAGLNRFVLSVRLENNYLTIIFYFQRF